MAEKGGGAESWVSLGEATDPKPGPSAYAGEIRPRVWPRRVPHDGDWNWGRKRIRVGKTEEAAVDGDPGSVPGCYGCDGLCSPPDGGRV